MRRAPRFTPDLTHLRHLHNLINSDPFQKHLEKNLVVLAFFISVRPLLTLLQFKNMNSFIEKRVISIFANLRYCRLKSLNYKENNRNSCSVFEHKIKTTPSSEMKRASFERYFLVLCDSGLTWKMSKLAFNPFFQIYSWIFLPESTSILFLVVTMGRMH